MSFTYYRDPHIRYVANQSEGEVFTLQTGQLSCVMRPGTIFHESAPQLNDAEKDGRCRGVDREDRTSVSPILISMFTVHSSDLKASTSTFTLKNLLRQYNNHIITGVLTHSLHLKRGHNDLD